MLRTGAAVAGLLLLVSCGGGGSEATPEVEPPSPSISTLSPLPMPDTGPPEGRLVADLRQSSRDAALGRFQVWIGNGLAREVDPRSIRYVDPRLPDPIPGERLRANPAGSERGYPLALPPRPDCDAPARARGTAVMRFDGRTARIRVQDEADVVERYVATRCFELSVERVATLTFDEQVPTEGEGEGSVGTLLLRVTPSGTPGGRLRIEQVTGTPLLTPETGPAWRPRATVRGDGDPVVLELPVVPARCDDHAFMESGGATAFRVNLRLDGRPGELVVRMPPAGASAALGFARDSCGLG